jgi:hypothetical protein
MLFIRWTSPRLSVRSGCARSWPSWSWPLLEAVALRLCSLPTDSGTALDVAGNGRYARKVVIADALELALDKLIDNRAYDRADSS